MTWVRRTRRLPVLVSLVIAPLGPTGLAAQSGASGRPGGNAETDSAAAELPAVVAAAGADGFGLRSADGSFSLGFRGMAHYQGRVFMGDGDQPVSGFDIRRVRADLQGTVYGDYDFRVNLDYAGNEVNLLDAYIEGRFSPAVNIRVGKFKAPVGLEVLQGVTALHFPERGYPTALVPNRDVGIQLGGALGDQVVTYAVGVFNGVTDGASGDSDVTDSKDVAARIFMHPFSGTQIEPLQGLGIGIAGTIGEQEGSPEATGLPAFRTSIGQNTFLRFHSDSTGEGSVVLDGRRTRIAPQAYWHWGSLGALAEYTRSTSDVEIGGVAGEVTNTAWQVVGLWMLTGEATSYGSVVPDAPFDPGAGTWGAWELAVRLQGIETDPLAFPLQANPEESALSASSYTVGLNWYLNRFVRLQADYEHTSFKAAAGGIELPSEGVFITRFQIGF